MRYPLPGLDKAQAKRYSILKWLLAALSVCVTVAFVTLLEVR